MYFVHYNSKSVQLISEYENHNAIYLNEYFISTCLLYMFKFALAQIIELALVIIFLFIIDVNNNKYAYGNILFSLTIFYKVKLWLIP